jgi:cytochrome c-type biogenesis protein
MSLTPDFFENISLLTLSLVFLGGIVTSIGPCNLATIPLIIGYVGGSTDLSRGRSLGLSLTFAIGLATTFMLLGLIASLVGGLFGSMSLWFYIVAGICFFIGLQMLGVLKFNIPSLFGSLREQVRFRGVPGAYALGLVSGIVASQCATPVLAAVLTYVMAQQGAVLYGALLLFVYALGRGVPVVLAGSFTGALRSMQALGRWSAAIEKASGVIILAVGFYFLWIA